MNYLRAISLWTLVLLVSLSDCLPIQAASPGDVQLPVKSDSGPLTPVWVTKQAGKVLGWDGSGNLGAITVASDWSSITGKPTTLSGYGITDSITAATAASTYQPLIGTGTLPLSKLATDPLARGNHTGYQAWSTIDGETLPTTLAGYGITDGITAATVSSTYAPLASPALTGTPTAPTATSGANTTQLATTAFVQAALSGAGAGISTPGIAYLTNTGNNATAVIGDPSHPFQTAQAALNAGAHIFVLSAGSFGDISGVTSDITLIGCGASICTVGSISGIAGSIRGNGRDCITTGGIYIVAANGTDGTQGDPNASVPASNGTDGGAAASITVSGLTTSDIILAGGNGGAGAYGGDGSGGSISNVGSNGGNGGAAATLTIQDCIVNGYGVTYGGTGGSGGNGTNSVDSSSQGGNGGNGGNGGFPGQVIVINSITQGTYAAAANAGAAGTNGTGSSSPSFTPQAGTVGAVGAINSYFSQIRDDVTNMESTTYRASLVNGTWYP